MTITQRLLRNQLVLTLTGRFDDHARKPVQRAVEQARAAQHRNLVIDLTSVPFMDSSALGFLALTHARLKKDHGQLTLVCPRGYVLGLLELANFHNLMPIVGTEQEIGETLAWT